MVITEAVQFRDPVRLSRLRSATPPVFVTVQSHHRRWGISVLKAVDSSAEVSSPRGATVLEVAAPSTAVGEAPALRGPAAWPPRYVAALVVLDMLAAALATGVVVGLMQPVAGSTDTLSFP